MIQIAEVQENLNIIKYNLNFIIEVSDGDINLINAMRNYFNRPSTFTKDIIKDVVFESVSQKLRLAGINVLSFQIGYPKSTNKVEVMAQCNLSWNRQIAGPNGNGLYDPQRSFIVDENPLAFTFSIALTDFINRKLVATNIKCSDVKATSRRLPIQIKRIHEAAGNELKIINNEMLGI